MGIKERANRLKRDIPAVFLALKHRQTPLPAKIFAAITVGYALSPVDLIPDFIPVLGYLDDLLLLPALAAITIKLIPNRIMELCRVEADGLWRSGKPKKWYCAIPVLFLWLWIVWMIFRRFTG